MKRKLIRASLMVGLLSGMAASQSVAQDTTGARTGAGTADRATQGSGTDPATGAQGALNQDRSLITSPGGQSRTGSLQAPGQMLRLSQQMGQAVMNPQGENLGR